MPSNAPRTRPMTARSDTSDLGLPRILAPRWGVIGAGSSRGGAPERQLRNVRTVVVAVKICGFGLMKSFGLEPTRRFSGQCDVLSGERLVLHRASLTAGAEGATFG